MMKHELVSIDEAAELTQVHSDTVRAWIARGLQTVASADGTPRIRRADLDAFLLRDGQGVARDAAREDDAAS
jgi:excisionase family DNA binding protein